MECNECIVIICIILCPTLVGVTSRFPGFFLNIILPTKPTPPHYLSTPPPPSPPHWPTPPPYHHPIPSHEQKNKCYNLHHSVSGSGRSDIFISCFECHPTYPDPLPTLLYHTKTSHHYHTPPPPPDPTTPRLILGTTLLDFTGWTT